jgi:hypothetical protein
MQALSIVGTRTYATSAHLDGLLNVVQVLELIPPLHAAITACACNLILVLCIEHHGSREDDDLSQAAHLDGLLNFVQVLELAATAACCDYCVR